MPVTARLTDFTVSGGRLPGRGISLPVSEGSIAMARRVIHELIDDLDGGIADESLSFGLDGVQYTIDLSAKNAAELRDVLAPYVAAATKLGRAPVPQQLPARGGRTRPVLSARAEREQNRAIRDWAQSKGLEVSDRGRIRADIVERFHAEAGS